MTAGRTRSLALIHDERGTASVEYTIVLVLLTFGMAFAIFSLGPRLVDFFELRVLWLSLPLP